MKFAAMSPLNAATILYKMLSEYSENVTVCGDSRMNFTARYKFFVAILSHWVQIDTSTFSMYSKFYTIKIFSYLY